MDWHRVTKDESKPLNDFFGGPILCDCCVSKQKQFRFVLIPRRGHDVRLIHDNDSSFSFPFVVSTIFLSRSYFRTVCQLLTLDVVDFYHIERVRDILYEMLKSTNSVSWTVKRFKIYQWKRLMRDNCTLQYFHQITQTGCFK